jgi:hypothetical protein
MKRKFPLGGIRKLSRGRQKKGKGFAVKVKILTANQNAHFDNNTFI